MKVPVNSSAKLKCEVCNNEISVLTLKLQQHPSSVRWLRHGQCSASCSAPYVLKEVNRIINPEEAVYSYRRSKHEKNGYHSDILLGLARGAALERYNVDNEMRKAQRLISTGAITATTGLLVAVIFFLFGYYYLVFAGLLLFVTGIVVNRMGACKRCRAKI